MVLFLSCKKQGPKQVYLYDEDGPEMLNGNVKMASIGDSTQKAGYFYKTYFDEEGNMSNSVVKHILVLGQDTVVTDTTTSIYKIKYTFVYGTNGEKTAIIGHGFTEKDTFKSKWEFDKKDHVVKYDPNTKDTVGGPLNEYQYDSIGNIIKRVCFYRNISLEPDIYKYKYDNKHCIIEKDLSDQSFLLNKTTFRYISFDSCNNWIEKEEHWQTYPPLRKESGVDTITRKITYY
ncbi:MAG: hypothetical protein ACXVB0_21020 [Mucilaginibacter sp.]